MVCRATRLFPDIGKETFRIFDAVGIFDSLQSLTTMKPVVVNPKLTLTQLLEQFARVTDPAHRSQLRDEILVKLRRTIAKLPPEADRKSTRLNSSHQIISYAVFCLKKKNMDTRSAHDNATPQHCRQYSRKNHH